MTLELKCDCGTRPSPTEEWKDVPNKCDVCNKQVLVRNVTQSEKSAPWKK